jgi:hypothetical protein
MNSRKDRDLLEGLQVPRAPADLEQRVLGAAADAIERDEPPTIWDRLWESRALRLAWASATLGLLLAHAGLALVSRSPESAGDLRSVDRRQAREIHELLALPVVEISPRAEALAMGSRRPSAKTRPSDGSRSADRS